MDEYVTSQFFFSHRFSVNDEDVRLMLWDTAGQEEFDAITKAYYRGKIAPLQQITFAYPIFLGYF